MKAAANQKKGGLAKPPSAIFFRQKLVWLISTCLALATLAVYWPLSWFPFVDYDDPVYVTENSFVRRGLTSDGLAWAFTTAHGSNWHPVTWLSHMLDWTLFGSWAGGHHLASLLFHVANTILLFAVMKRMTGALWRSAFVAALFALHPLHVESVAWVSERKDVLSTLFFLLTLWAYVRYAELKSRHTRRFTLFYALTLVSFALGLMSKPMLVSLPFLLLLLDYWPLRRLRPRFTGHDSLIRLLREKAPLFLLAILSCAATIWAQHAGGSIISVENLPVSDRVANGLLSYWRYVQATLWPLHLSFFYPFDASTPAFLVWLAAIALVVATCAAIALRNQRWVAVGWLWFVGVLVPVIGLVQVGQQARADRYSYIPSIGLFLIAAFGLNALAMRLRSGKILMATAAGLILAGCMTAARSQVWHWRDSEALFRHAIEVTKGNYVAYNNLGVALRHQGKLDEAIGCYHQALRWKSDYVEAHNNLGPALMEKGLFTEAESHLRQALQTNPKSFSANYNLAILFCQEEKIEAAIAAYRDALALDDTYPEAHNALGCLLAAHGEPDEAIGQFQQALLYRPGSTDALNNLGSTLTDQGRAAEAVPLLLEALQLKPEYADAYHNLGNAYSALKKPREAIVSYQAALRLNPRHGLAHYKAGNLLLGEGNADAAAEQYRAALAVNPNLPEAHYQLATLLVPRKEVVEGIDHYREALRLKPDWVEALNNLAWLLATHPDTQFRDGKQAVELAARATQLTRTNDAEALDTLAAAYGETERFPEAVTTARKGVQIAQIAGQKDLAAQIQARLEVYKANRPYHEP